VSGGPPGEPAGAVANRSSPLVQMPLNPVCTLPSIWTTMVPGVGLAKVPGSAAASALLFSLAAAIDLADGSAVNCPCVGAVGGTLCPGLLPKLSFR
jgi:hypothetical protein